MLLIQFLMISDFDVYPFHSYGGCDVCLVLRQFCILTIQKTSQLHAFETSKKNWSCINT